MSLPIYGANRLAHILGWDRKWLEKIATRAAEFYRPFEKPRIGKKPRLIDHPISPLKDIQALIKEHILDEVSFPSYVLGGVKGGSAWLNASLHRGKRVVITVDVVDCFPSISNNRVFRIWCNRLGCSPTVSHILTQLTTFEGHLPQGAPTSTCLANLALLPVVEECREMVSILRLELSQFVDDVGISGNLSDFDIITDISQIFSRHGFRIGRHKLHLMRCGRAQKVTGFTVNRSLGIPRKGRSRIRAAVHELERSTLCSEALACHCRKVMGRIRHMGAFHPGVAEKLVRRVEEVAKSCG